jgi:excisionase family DNA binding protein
MLERAFELARKHLNNKSASRQEAIDSAEKILHAARVFDPLYDNSFHKVEDRLNATGSAFLSINEAAESLGYHPSALRNLILRGGIEATKIGRVWYISPDTLKSFTRIPAGRPRKRTS